jgi:hypothetical protein
VPDKVPALKMELSAALSPFATSRMESQNMKTVEKGTTFPHVWSCLQKVWQVYSEPIMFLLLCDMLRKEKPSSLARSPHFIARLQN